MAQLTVTWTDGSHKHRVYYREQGDTTWILATPTGVAAGTATYTIRELEAATNYEVAVSAWNQADNLESGFAVAALATLRGSVASDPMVAATGRLAPDGTLHGSLASDAMVAATGRLFPSGVAAIAAQQPIELQSLSVWTDVEANSGTRESIFTLGQILACEDVDGLDNEERLTATVLRTAAAWSDVEPGKVLRAEYLTGDWREWRIRTVESARGAGSTGTIVCEGILYDLLRLAGLVEVSEADGFSDHDIHISLLTPAEWWDLIAASPNFPSYINQGTIEPVTRVTIPIDGDRPLAVLNSARTALDTLEEGKPNIRLRASGTMDYKLDLLDERGADAELALVGEGVNLSAMTHREDGTELGSQAYVFGGGPRGSQLGMQHHRFKLANVTGTTVDLTQPDGSSEQPIKIADILNNLYVEAVKDGTNAQVTDTVIANNRLTFSAVPGSWANDDLVVVKRNSNLDGLNYLDHPGRPAYQQGRTVKWQRSDIVGVDNLLSNGLCNQFSGPGPDNWNAVGGAVLSQETTRPWWLHGGASIKVVAAGTGDGIESDAVDLDATVTNPFYVGQVWLIAETLDSGARVKVQLVDVDTGEAFPQLGNESSALQATLAPTMVPVLTGINWQVRGTSQLKLRVTVEGGAATFRLDAGMIFRGVNPSQNIQEGYASNRLWSLTQDLLLGQKGTPIDNFECDATDLNRVDATAYPHSALEVGGTVLLKDEQLGVDVQTRIVKRTRNLLVAGDTRLELSDKRRDLVGMLGKREVPAVIDAAPPMSGDPLSSGRGLAVMAASSGHVQGAPIGESFSAGALSARMKFGFLGLQAGDIQLVPFTVSNKMIVDELSCWVTGDGRPLAGGVWVAGAGSVRVGIYRDTGELYPGNVVYQSGDLSVTVSASSDELTVTGLSIDLEPGVYYWAAVQVTAVTNPGSEMVMLHGPMQAEFGPTGTSIQPVDTMRPILGIVQDIGFGGDLDGVYSFGLQRRSQGGTMTNPLPSGATITHVRPAFPSSPVIFAPVVKLHRSA